VNPRIQLQAYTKSRFHSRVLILVTGATSVTSITFDTGPESDPRVELYAETHPFYATPHFHDPDSLFPHWTDPELATLVRSDCPPEVLIDWLIEHATEPDQQELSEQLQRQLQG